MNRVKTLIMENKQYISDYVYNMGSMLILQIVLQLIVYPLINFWQGEEALGNVVYYMSIVYIFAQAAGYSLCQTRLIVRREYETTNGDYNFISAILIALSTLLGVICVSKSMQVSDLLGYALIFIATSYRFYCTVEYRLKLDFKLCFVFFLIISIGYLLGTVLFFLTGKWYFIFIVGEFAAVIYILIKGSIFKHQPFSNNTKKLSKAIIILCISSLITYCIENFDRIVLLNFINAKAVSVYYAVSLIGKTLLIFVGPINTITLSYVSANKQVQTRGKFLSAFSIYLAVGFVFYILCLIGTPIFTKIFYPNIYPEIHGLNIIVNAAQILGLVSSLPIVLLLNSLGSKYHLRINLLYAIIYLPLAIFFSLSYGLTGYAWASLISNAFKMIVVLSTGYIKLKK